MSYLENQLGGYALLFLIPVIQASNLCPETDCSDWIFHCYTQSPPSRNCTLLP